MVSLPRPGSTTYMDDSGFEGDLVIDAISDAVEALFQPLTINGNMDHFQRVVGGSQTSTTTYNTLTNYAADRIFVLPAGASVTQARSTTVPDTKSRYSLAVTGAASVTTVDIGQRIKSAIVNTRGLQSLVFSCYVRNESGAAYTPTLRIGTPGSADDFTTVTNRLSQSLQSCADSAWTRVYHVFDPSAYTNIANGMEVVLRIPSGSSVSGDTNRIAQFDLRPGGSLVAYVPPDPSDELLRCMAHCWKNCPQAQAPFATQSAQSYVVQATPANGEYYISVSLPVPMVKTPSVSMWPYTTGTNTGRSSDGGGADYAASSADAPAPTATVIAIRNASGGSLTLSANKLVFVGILAIAEY